MHPYLILPFVMFLSHLKLHGTDYMLSGQSHDEDSKRQPFLLHDKCLSNVYRTRAPFPQTLFELRGMPYIWLNTNLKGQQNLALDEHVGVFGSSASPSRIDGTAEAWRTHLTLIS